MVCLVGIASRESALDTGLKKFISISHKKTIFLFTLWFPCNQSIMSVVEVVGLTLAVVPLIISAIEHYNIAFQPLVTYCQYNKKLRDFRDRLNFQKRIFQSHCAILLGKVKADEILNDLSKVQLKWKKSGFSEEEQKVEERLAFYLGQENYEACALLIRLIENVLLKIQEDSKGLEMEYLRSADDMNSKVNLPRE